MENDRFWPGATAEALQCWQDFVATPGHRIWRPTGCELPCCPNPYELRPVLDAVVAVLPPRDAREIRRRIAEIDSHW
ncbi:hypothetical protein [Allokutzneria oryzae]|uniref:Uncharacterized protein n=1 Tax=Allokutzneria oryzae TaxID=1378989 RepID=A0ABV6A436_9PSEU